MKWGSSYITRTELILLKRPIDSMEVATSSGQTGGPASIGLFFDAVGHWHGGRQGDRTNYRNNVAYLDGHAKNLNYNDYINLWTQQVR